MYSTCMMSAILLRVSAQVINGDIALSLKTLGKGEIFVLVDCHLTECCSSPIQGQRRQCVWLHARVFSSSLQRGWVHGCSHDATRSSSM